MLYSFCAQAGCTDGAYTEAGLTGDTSGTLYGTTQYGGAHGDGTVFELTLNAAKTGWTETVLYSFCTQVGLHRWQPALGRPDHGHVGEPLRHDLWGRRKQWRHGVRAPQRSQDHVDGNGAVQLLRAGWLHRWRLP
ncbi:MAG: hypothetical protein WA624_01980 [Methylocella sp.]